MKRLTAILIVLCLAVQSVAQVAVLGLFELRKEYIAKNLCENRDKPKLSCCGKCYLGKQLKKADEENAPSGNTPSKAVKSEVPPCVLPVPFIAGTATGFAAQAAPRRPILPRFHDRLTIAAIFHPPSVFC